MQQQGLPASVQPVLQDGLRTLGLSLSAHQQTQLLTYMQLLLDWNRVYNLTAIRQPQEVLTHHVLDSLSIIPLLQRHAQGRALRVLDVGSGGGLPGCVIAICQPQWPVVCVDAVAKKAAFVQQVAARLQLPSLQGRHARVQQVAGGFDVITARAFATLADFTSWTQHALAADGVWLAMKGKHPAAELAALPSGVEVFHVEQLQVPHLDAERCAVWMRPGLVTGTVDA